MTPKQILDSFSETLMQDERILSARERALLAALLHHAKNISSDNPETRAAVSAAIASAVGETVAQRAFAVLGGSMVERIVEASATAATDSEVEMRGPQPPAPAPYPAPHPGPGPGMVRPSMRGPQPPAPAPYPAPHPGPGPGAVRPVKTLQQDPASVTVLPNADAVSQSSIVVLDRPQMLPAECVVLDEFLAPQELEQLLSYTLQHEADFQHSEVVTPAATGVVDQNYRRSRVLFDTGAHGRTLLNRIHHVLPQVLEKLGMQDFPCASIETQITASQGGDFFLAHQDSGQGEVVSRHLTFVYFFHREPARFTGGELRIHDARLENDQYVSNGSYHTIAPQQNQIVFFPSNRLHEITPVKCPSIAFADSRFTLNGWLRK